MHCIQCSLVYQFIYRATVAKIKGTQIFGDVQYIPAEADAVEQYHTGEPNHSDRVSEMLVH